MNFQNIVVVQSQRLIKVDGYLRIEKIKIRDNIVKKFETEGAEGQDGQ